MNINQLKAEIINKRIIKIYRGKKPIDSFDFDGLGTLHTYRFIMELDNGKKYAFNRDYVWEWDDSEAVIALNTKLKSHYENQQILEIIDVGDYYFLLENRRVLHHDQNFGSELVCEPYESLFNEKGEMI